MSDDYTDPDQIMSPTVDPAAALATYTPAPATAPRNREGAQLSAQIRGLNRTASTWAWPADVIEAIADDEDPEESARHLRRLREAARDNTREGLTLARRALDAGRVDEARSLFGRASTRWNQWIRQASEIERRIRSEQRSWWENVTEAAEDLDALDLANAAESAMDEAIDAGKSALLVVGLGALLVLGVSLNRR